jgi:hypothetical protein
VLSYRDEWANFPALSDSLNVETLWTANNDDVSQTTSPSRQTLHVRLANERRSRGLTRGAAPVEARCRLRRQIGDIEIAGKLAWHPNQTQLTDGAATALHEPRRSTYPTKHPTTAARQASLRARPASMARWRL